MDLAQLKDWLTAQGFRIASDPCNARDNEVHWYAYRRSELKARECECNDGKPAQIVIKPFAYVLVGTRRESVEIALTGEYGVWWQLKAYGMTPAEVPEKLASVEASLVRSWNALEATGQ
jgi:hypothetical protein